jgi:pimeloyl-ACP methyl ester carboxylesterase
LGGCIGGSFCLKIAQVAPDRVTSAVLQNPIGLHPDHPEYFPESHIAWSAEQRAERPELDKEAIRGFGQNMWGGDFVFCVDREFVRNCPVPTMLLPGTDIPHPAATSDELARLLPGTDIPHPAATSDELARLLPGVEIVYQWRGPEFMEEQRKRVTAFLDRHPPK